MQAGRLLARGKTISEIKATLGNIDGADAAAVVAKLCKAKGVETPILRGLADVLAGQVDLATAVASNIR